MLPASNRGAGSSLNFPDVCKTPAPPAPFIPVPYPSIGLNMQSAPFSPFVSIGFMPATNMGTLKVMTSGDELGAIGGLVTGIIKGPGKTTVGNPIVFVSGLPGESLLNPTAGNNMNAPVGAQIVPSVVNVLYTLVDAPVVDPGALDPSHLAALGAVARGDATEVVADQVAPGVGRVRLDVFSSHADRDLFVALDAIGGDGLHTLILDLRACRGGDAAAALRVAGAFLPEGTTILRARDADGDDEPIPARFTSPYPWRRYVRCDCATSSAADVLSCSLRHHGRAVVVGTPTYGKATAQAVVSPPSGGPRYATVATYLLPDGRPIDGVGVEPHHVVESAHALERCVALAVVAP